MDSGYTEHQRIHFLGQHGLEVFARSQARHFMFQPAFFHQWHEQWAGL